MTEAEFMDPDNWGETSNGNQICRVEMGLVEYTVVIFKRHPGWGFVIYYGLEGKVFGRNRYSTEKAARYWAWMRMELMT